MIRTSTLIGEVAPIGTTSPSCSARSSLACSVSGISAISSSNRVPPSAARKNPSEDCMAPVKAPFWWPNSSASSMASGMAAQFTAMNGPSRRGLRAWM